MNNLIYLIGYRGVGKTTVGRRLADVLGYEFLDTDREITRRKKAEIFEIVASKGWQAFRQCEEKVLLGTSGMKNTVVATGGGAVLHRNIWSELRKCSVVFWLTADTEVILQRIRDDAGSASQRPSLTGADDEGEVRLILEERLPLYQQTAHYKVDTSLINVEDAVSAMQRQLFLETQD